MTCTACRVGPGKFEGEPALAALAYSASLNGSSDATTGEHPVVDWFRSPFNFDVDPTNVEFALATGYCTKCVQEALEADVYGLDIFEDSQGFIYLKQYDTREGFDNALALAIEGDQQAAEEAAIAAEEERTERKLGLL